MHQNNRTPAASTVAASRIPTGPVTTANARNPSAIAASAATTRYRGPNRSASVPAQMGSGSATRLATVSSTPTSASGTSVSRTKYTSESGANRPLPTESTVRAATSTNPPRLRTAADASTEG